MKIAALFLGMGLGACGIFAAVARAEGPELNLKKIPADQNTTISIQKGVDAGAAFKDFEIIDGTDDIEGDPTLGEKGARDSWKAACEIWKKDFRESNQGSQIVSMNCGKAVKDRDANNQVTFSSTATYKLRVAVKK